MRKSSRLILIIVCAVIGVFSSFSYAGIDFDKIIISRLTNLVNIYGKRMVLQQVIGRNSNDFTIDKNNKLSKSPLMLEGINTDYINVYTIYHDMTRYKISIEELEKNLPIEDARLKEEKERQEKIRVQQKTQAKKEAAEKAALDSEMVSKASLLRGTAHFVLAERALLRPDPLFNSRGEQAVASGDRLVILADQGEWLRVRSPGNVTG